MNVLNVKCIEKTYQQKKYIKSLRNVNKKVSIVTGPAGTGKTLFACEEAAYGYTENKYKKIIITRPIIGVDEDLGYLPGTYQDKLSPWLRPITDILKEYFSTYQLYKMNENEHIEIAPLSYMRGRTFNNSCIIADEMQNSTPNQMKMLLTRIGYDSKMIVIGDNEQSDLKEKNGLEDIIERIEDRNVEKLEYIDYVILKEDDIKRHPAVSEINSLYTS